MVAVASPISRISLKLRPAWIPWKRTVLMAAACYNYKVPPSPSTEPKYKRTEQGMRANVDLLGALSVTSRLGKN
jgi:hypothetical protein